MELMAVKCQGDIVFDARMNKAPSLHLARMNPDRRNEHAIYCNVTRPLPVRNCLVEVLKLSVRSKSYLLKNEDFLFGSLDFGYGIQPTVCILTTLDDESSCHPAGNLHAGAAMKVSVIPEGTCRMLVGDVDPIQLRSLGVTRILLWPYLQENVIAVAGRGGVQPVCVKIGDIEAEITVMVSRMWILRVMMRHIWQFVRQADEKRITRSCANGGANEIAVIGAKLNITPCDFLPLRVLDNELVGGALVCRSDDSRFMKIGKAKASDELFDPSLTLLRIARVGGTRVRDRHLRAS
ncbi:hypothetical protein AOQ72_02925 [Bradyrhizobium yuanmingense]|uniref:Uncharacterized protein n=1 Tax=Bradyrhizobium yuanmingense TaxID=108015 RepID=A0A0R3BNU4_9BRAD|nr:hypothetical protein AOQ72_02925 [Bradyrhizobium yuanmingense]